MASHLSIEPVDEYLRLLPLVDIVAEKTNCWYLVDLLTVQHDSDTIAASSMLKTATQLSAAGCQTNYWSRKSTRLLSIEPVYENLQLLPLVLVGKAEVTVVHTVHPLVLVDHPRPPARDGNEEVKL